MRSRNAKESGPVRAKGKFGESHRDQSYHHTYQPHGYQRAEPEFSRKGIELPKLDLDDIYQTSTSLAKKAVEHEESERPSKRQRQEGHSSPSGQPITLDDDDVMEQIASNTDASSTRYRSPVTTSSSSQQSAKTKKVVRTSLPSSAGEYRDLEDSLKVKKPRNTPSKEPGRLPFLPARDPAQFITTVDTLQSHRSVRPTDTESPGKKRGASSLSMERRHSDGRESPDVLQGEVTVQSPPTPVIRDRTKDGPNGISTHRTAGISPPDIRPTEFVSSPRKSDRKKPMAAGRSPGKSVFEAVSVRMGPTVIQSSPGQTIELQVDRAKGVLRVPPQPGHGEIAHNIPLMKLGQIVFGKEPSHKLRLRMSNSGSIKNLVDIELSSQQGKQDLCSALAHTTVKILEKER